MNLSRRAFFPFAGLLVAGCTTYKDVPPPDPNYEDVPPPDPNLGNSTGINPFAIDLYTQLRTTTKQNIFVSPFSISSALAMTAGGAQGNTLSQMCTAMRFAGAAEEPVGHEKFAQLMLTFTAKQRESRPYELNIANAIWAQKSYPWKQEYLKLVSGKYRTQLQSVDFQRNFEEQRLAINKWVEDVTKEKIKELFAKDAINHRTRMVLVNAIYYKGVWEKPFIKSATTDAPFHFADGTKQDRPTMQAEQTAKLFENDDVQFLELPYKGKQTSMLILLPRKTDGLSAIEQKLTIDRWNEWTQAMKSENVAMKLPKFKLETRYGLNDPLMAMGMTDAFDELKANFHGMVTSMPEGPLYISTVVHKAYCDVNEEGTEAAAATGVGFQTTSAIIPPAPKVFRADHPFLFAIRHNPTNAILFLGRVNNPKG